MDHHNELIRILTLEKTLYTELANLAHAKQKVIIANEVQQLADLIKKEQDLIDHIESVEAERRTVVIGLCSDMNISEKELSFTRLREHLDESFRRKLDIFKTELMVVLEDLQTTNETNRMLIEEALRINDFTVRVLTQAATPAPTTYGKGGMNQESSLHLIDKKA